MDEILPEAGRKGRRLRRLLCKMFVQKPSDEGFFALNKDIGRLFNPTVSGGCVCNAYLTESFLGSMASAKYLVLSSERNVKKSLEIRLSKTSQEHLQI